MVLVVVSDETAEKRLVRPSYFKGRHGAKAFQKLARLEKLTPWGFRDRKALRGLDLVQPLEKVVVGWFLGIGEDVVTSHPAEKNKPDQQKKEDGPSEEAIGRLLSPAASRITLITVVAFAGHES